MEGEYVSDKPDWKVIVTIVGIVVIILSLFGSSSLVAMNFGSKSSDSDVHNMQNMPAPRTVYNTNSETITRRVKQ